MQCSVVSIILIGSIEICQEVGMDTKSGLAAASFASWNPEGTLVSQNFAQSCVNIAQQIAN